MNIRYSIALLSLVPLCISQGLRASEYDNKRDAAAYQADLVYSPQDWAAIQAALGNSATQEPDKKKRDAHARATQAETCVICLDTPLTPQTREGLPCGHSQFCQSCIATLRNQTDADGNPRAPKCPECRKPIQDLNSSEIAQLGFASTPREHLGARVTDFQAQEALTWLNNHTPGLYAMIIEARDNKTLSDNDGIFASLAQQITSQDQRDYGIQADNVGKTRECLATLIRFYRPIEQEYRKKHAAAVNRQQALQVSPDVSIQDSISARGVIQRKSQALHTGILCSSC